MATWDPNDPMGQMVEGGLTPWAWQQQGQQSDPQSDFLNMLTQGMPLDQAIAQYQQIPGVGNVQSKYLTKNITDFQNTQQDNMLNTYKAINSQNNTDTDNTLNQSKFDLSNAQAASKGVLTPDSGDQMLDVLLHQGNTAEDIAATLDDTNESPDAWNAYVNKLMGEAGVTFPDSSEAATINSAPGRQFYESVNKAAHTRAQQNMDQANDDRWTGMTNEGRAKELYLNMTHPNEQYVVANTPDIKEFRGPDAQKQAQAYTAQYQQALDIQKRRLAMPVGERTATSQKAPARAASGGSSYWSSPTYTSNNRVRHQDELSPAIGHAAQATGRGVQSLARALWTHGLMGG